MAETTTDTTARKIRVVLGPAASRLLEGIPQADRVTALDAIVELHAVQDDMITTQQAGLVLVLEEIKNTRALIGSELTEDDERQALISRMHEVTEQREAAAAHLAGELGLALSARRKTLDEGMSHLEPVVRDARDPEQDTELQHQDRGGRER